MQTAATEEDKAQLEKLLRAGVHCAIGLKETLNDERTALEQQDVDALDETAKHKQEFLTRLERLEDERRLLCESIGWNADPSAMEQIIRACDSDSLLIGHWTHYVGLARECSELNVRNGSIINLRRQQIADTLSAIRGEDQDYESYGRDGRDTGSGNKRTLAQI